MKKLKISFLTLLAAAAVAFAATATADARNCGSYRGVKIVTHGVTCRTAKRVYKRFDTGATLPSGWICGRSAGSCQRDAAHYFTFRFN